MIKILLSRTRNCWAKNSSRAENLAREEEGKKGVRLFEGGVAVLRGGEGIQYHTDDEQTCLFSRCLEKRLFSGLFLKMGKTP